MAYKYQTFADLLYTSYSGLQMLAFAFGKGKNRCDKDCYAFRQSVIRKLKAGEMKIGDLYQNIIRQMISPHDACWYCGRSVSVCGSLTADHIFPRMKIGERSGMGLSQLYVNWEEAGYARPQLSESFNPERTKVEIEVEVAEKVAENSSQVAEKQGEVAEKVAENRREYTEKPSEYTEKYTEKQTEKSGEYTEKQTEKSGEYTENMAQSIANLTETEERIVAILRQNKFATQGGISAQLGITRTYITKIMGGLQARNIIRRIGPDKGGYWVVLSQ